MKPLIKTTVNRGGGIAGRIVPSEADKEAGHSQLTEEDIKVARKDFKIKSQPRVKEPKAKIAKNETSTFDRKTYMREYMRKKRDADKTARLNPKGD